MKCIVLQLVLLRFLRSDGLADSEFPCDMYGRTNWSSFQSKTLPAALFKDTAFSLESCQTSPVPPLFLILTGPMMSVSESVIERSLKDPP